MGIFSGFFGKKKSTRQLPVGWTETKISENEYLLHIPEEQKQKWKVEQRSKDQVELLINKDGFHLKPHGRDGMVYYAEQGKLCEIYFEISGVPQFDLLFEFSRLGSWFYPENLPISETEKEEIKQKFVTWLKKEKIRGNLY